MILISEDAEHHIVVPIRPYQLKLYFIDYLPSEGGGGDPAVWEKLKI